MYSDVEGLCFLKVRKTAEVFLKYFKMVHKKFISQFFLESYSWFRSTVKIFEFSKFFDIHWASIYVKVGFLSIWEGSVVFRANLKLFFSSTYIRATASTREFIALITRIQFITRRFTVFDENLFHFQAFISISYMKSWYKWWFTKVRRYYSILGLV